VQSTVFGSYGCREQLDFRMVCSLVGYFSTWMMPGTVMTGLGGVLNSGASTNAGACTTAHASMPPTCNDCTSPSDTPRCVRANRSGHTLVVMGCWASSAAYPTYK